MPPGTKQKSELHWGSTLVGYFADRKMALAPISLEAKNLWNGYGFKEVVKHE